MRLLGLAVAAVLALIALVAATTMAAARSDETTAMAFGTRAVSALWM